MDKLFGKMWTLVTHGQDISLEIRFFRLIIVTVAFLALFLVLPTNLLQDLSIYLNLLIASYGLASLVLYYCSYCGSHHVKSFFGITMLVLNLAWFLNGGSLGSIGYYIFAAGLYPLVFFRGRTRQVMLLLLVLDVCALMVVDYRFPSLAIPYRSPLDRLLDLTTGYATSLFAYAIVFWVVVTTMERELAERRRAEVALCQERDRAQGYLDTVETVIVALDTRGDITTVNRKGCQLLGYREAELLGRNWFEEFVVQPPGCEDLLSIYRDLMSARRPPVSGQFERTVRTRSGEPRHILWHYSLLYGPQGRITGTLGSGEDITDRKLAEEALRESEQALRLKTALLEALYNATPDGVLVIDHQNRRVFVNRRFKELLGVPEHILAQEDDAPLLEYVLGLVRFPDAFLGKVRYLNEHPEETCRDEVEFKNGLVLERYSAPVLSPDGKNHGRLWTFRDVTDQKKYETERVKMEKLESLGVLAGGIAHDFNNILAGILGGISLAQEFVGADHPSAKPLQTAEKASVRAAELARQLITFAKGGDLVKKVVSVRQVVEETALFALRGSNVRPVLDIPETLFSIRADEGQIGQAFHNLVINAKQAMPDGGIITISARNTVLPEPNVYALPAGDYVKLTCADQGHGIAEADLVRIFDPYFTTKRGGTGLGLASVYSILAKHGGNISVSSQPGKGAAFTMYLPAAEVSSAAPQPELPNAIGVHSGGCILVMDDEETIRDLAADMLRYLGYRVATCEDGAQAVALFREASGSGVPFDAVIMDLTIPGGMGGKEAAAEILTLDPSATLIVSSGYSTDPILADFAAYGFRGAVAKPYRIAELGQLLSGLLHKGS